MEYRLESLVVDYVFDGPVVRNTSTLDDQVVYGRAKSLWFERKESLGFFACKGNYLEHKTITYMPKAVGRVSLFGIVYEHEIGYRAQCMRIDSLVIGKDLAVARDDLIRIYRCPVEVTKLFSTWHYCFVEEALSILGVTG